MGNVFRFLHLPQSWGLAYGPVLIAILAITILHLVVRFMRIAANELMGRVLPVMRVPVIGTVVALILTFALVTTGTFKYIWVLFGSANQLMASLALMIGSVWLVSEKKKAGFALVPMVFMYLTTMAALVLTCWQLLKQAATGLSLAGAKLPAGQVAGNWIAGIIGVALFVAALVLAYDGVRALLRFGRRERQTAKGVA
jgi:carbon starvation protein